MSYAETPEPNPYAAPVSNIVDQDLGQPSGYTGYSGFWRRFAAYFIDSILMGIVGLILGFVLQAILAATNNAGPGSVQLTASLLLQLVSIGISVAYYAGMESSASQATVGKQAMGIRVTDMYGRRITFGRAVGRFFAKMVSAIILCIGFIMVAFTEKKQGLHDMMAGTLVLKTR